jgi:hypothetical protein
MLKIIHIHTDIKFLYLSKSFYSDQTRNTEVLILKDDGGVGYLKNLKNLVIFHDDVWVLSKLKRICEINDVVVLYDLDYLKVSLVNSLNSTQKIIWRFFGHEIYNDFRDLFLSDRTKSKLEPRKFNVINRAQSYFKLQSYYKIRKYIFGYKYNKYLAIGRIDYMLCLFREEYEKLLEIVGFMPDFIQAPLFSDKASFNERLLSKKNKIIIGNSKNFYNNHLDILEELPVGDGVEYILPFSYGYDCLYSENVRELATRNGIELLEIFLSVDEYLNLIRESSAICSNAYRQMAIGNLLMALETGSKIYLNKKNPAYIFFKRRGFLVYDIEYLRDDILNCNYMLSEGEIKLNIALYNQLEQDFSKSSLLDFLKKHFNRRLVD